MKLARLGQRARQRLLHESRGAPGCAVADNIHVPVRRGGGSRPTRRGLGLIDPRLQSAKIASGTAGRVHFAFANDCFTRGVIRSGAKVSENTTKLTLESQHRPMCSPREHARMLTTDDLYPPRRRAGSTNSNRARIRSCGFLLFHAVSVGRNLRPNS